MVDPVGMVAHLLEKRASIENSIAFVIVPSPPGALGIANGVQESPAFRGHLKTEMAALAGGNGRHGPGNTDQSQG